MPALLQNRKVIFAVAGVLVLGAVVWGGVSWSRHSSQPPVPREFTVEAIKAKMETENDPGKVWEQMHQLRERTDLTEEQRRQAFENAHAVMEEQMNKRLDAYFAATDEKQRLAMLDRDIDEMQRRMKERQQREAQAGRTGGPGARGPGGGGSGGPPRATGGAGGSGGGAGVAQGPQAPGGAPGTAAPGGGPPGGWRGGGPPTREQQKMRTESRDPDQSARRMAYFTALRKRAEQRGIQMPTFGRGPGGR